MPQKQNGIPVRASLTRDPDESLADAQAELVGLLADDCPPAHRVRAVFFRFEDESRDPRRQTSRRIHGKALCKPVFSRGGDSDA